MCGLVWSTTSRELVTTHGYTQNEIIVWKYPSMSRLAVLTGHTKRVLYIVRVNVFLYACVCVFLCLCVFLSV